MMQTPNLNKLSIEFLAEAFTVEESPPKFGKVFAVYGQKETLNTLSAFLKALRPDDPTEQLWYRPFVVSPKVPPSSVVLGCMDSARDVCPEDFPLALDEGLFSSSKHQGDVWGTLLRLT